VHSRRTVAIQRSAIALARGARTGVMTRTEQGEHFVEDAGVLVPRSRMRNPMCSTRSPKVHHAT